MIQIHYPPTWRAMTEAAEMTLETGLMHGHNRQMILAMAEQVARAARATGLTANGLGQADSAQAIATAIQIIENGGVYRFLVQLRQNSPAYREKDRQFLYKLLRAMAYDRTK